MTQVFGDGFGDPVDRRCQDHQVGERLATGDIVVIQPLHLKAGSGGFVGGAAAFQVGSCFFGCDRQRLVFFFVLIFFCVFFVGLFLVLLIALCFFVLGRCGKGQVRGRAFVACDGQVDGVFA